MNAKYIDDIIADPSHGYLVGGRSTYELDEFTDQLSKRLIQAKNKGDTVRNIIRLSTDDASITVKQINDLIAQVKLAQSGTNRVFIIAEAHKLTLTASNALLKSLEEPSKNTIFLLTTVRPQAIQTTVRSRLQHIDIGQQIDESSINNILADQDEQTAKIIRTVSAGDSALVKEYTDNPKQLLADVALVKSVFAGDYYERVLALKPYWKDRMGLIDLVNKMMAISRAALHASSDNNAKAFQWAAKVEVCLKAKERLERNVLPRTVIMELMVQL